MEGESQGEECEGGIVGEQQERVLVEKVEQEVVKEGEGEGVEEGPRKIREWF